MAMNSLLPYVTGVIDGLTIPGGTGTLQAFYVPPIQKPLDGPLAYLQIGPSRGARQSAPRPMAFKQIEWWIEIYLKYLANPNQANLAQAFPLTVDAILYAYWFTTMPTQITDTVTNRTTQIIAIGEEFEILPAPPESPAPFRSMLFDTLLRIQVKEALQA